MYFSGSKSKLAMSLEKPSHSENLNPNMCNRDNCVNVVLHQNRIGRRKFVVAKKKKNRCFEKNRVLCKCKENSDGGKCVCEAYENLRASQEGFFDDEGEEKVENVLEEVIEANLIIHDVGNEERKLDDGEDDDDGDEDGKGCHTAMVKRRRERVLEEARNSVPENGKVMHLVKAFERLLSINSYKEKEGNEDDDEKKRVMKWALPGLQFQREVNECETEQVDGCSDEMFNCILTSQQLGLDQRSSVSSSWDCGNGRFLFFLLLLL